MIDFNDQRKFQAWQIAWSQLQACDQPDGLCALLPNRRHVARRSLPTELLVSPARATLPLLIGNTRYVEIAPALIAAIPLIGAGPGLTPSWDDLLIGYFCGLRATTAKNLSQVRFLSQFGEAVISASKVTTAVSRAYIASTIEGRGPKWVEDVLASIGTGDSLLTSCMVDRALRIGNTSGTDMMLGAVLGSAVWQARTPIIDVLTVLACRNVQPLNARQAS